MTNLELASYYADLLILQYKDKPRAYQTVYSIIRDLVFIELVNQFQNGYNIETAVGYAQDILGKYLGVSRRITGAVFDRDYFGYLTYGETPPKANISGYAQYGVEAPDVQFRTYKDSNSSLYDLTDDEYRIIQRLKIISNNSNSSTESIDNLITEIFGGDIIFNDRQNMTISYIFSEGVQRLVTIAQSQDLLPRPMAVGVSVSFTPDILNIFGYSEYGKEPPSFVVGYAQYGQPTVGGWAKYG